MNNNYSAQDKLEFQRNQKWIAFESIFRTLNEHYQGGDIAVLDLCEKAKVVVDWMLEQWPMQDIKDEPFPTQVPKKTFGAKEPPSHCPECGADVKFKSGVSKAGKPYSFTGCSAYPECKWIFK
jgi:hypothetical protein